jgi:hypothetical protein
MPHTELGRLQNRLSSLAALDHASAESLLRDSQVYARQTFGEDSPHVHDLACIAFRSKTFIYNTGHYKNQEHWDAGKAHLQNTFNSMLYELDLIKSARRALTPPEKVTFKWLFEHVPLSVWATCIGALLAAAAIGYSAGSTAFLPKLLALFKS